MTDYISILFYLIYNCNKEILFLIFLLSFILCWILFILHIYYYPVPYSIFQVIVPFMLLVEMLFLAKVLIGDDDRFSHVHTHTGDYKGPLPTNVPKVTYFNKPGIIYVGEPVEVKLIIVDSILKDFDVKLHFLSLTGDIFLNKEVRIGKYISAALSASDMDIRATSEHVQKVEKRDTAIFSWFVTPLKVGEIPIRLDLFSQDRPEKDAPGRTIQVMQEVWVADARGLHWIKYELAELTPIGNAIVGLLAALGAVLAFLGIKTIQVWTDNAGNKK